MVRNIIPYDHLALPTVCQLFFFSESTTVQRSNLFTSQSTGDYRNLERRKRHVELSDIGLTEERFHVWPLCCCTPERNTLSPTTLTDFAMSGYRYTHLNNIDFLKLLKGCSNNSHWEETFSRLFVEQKGLLCCMESAPRKRASTKWPPANKLPPP